MNKNLAEIAFVLDRSGSMESCADAAIEGFNHFLKEQQEVKGLAKLTLVLFDDEYLVPVESLPVAEMTPLTRATYQPRNSTALLDAIGQCVDDLGARLAGLAEADRPSQVIVVILTDGLENASRKYSWKDVSDRIRHQTETYQWTFLFLGANQDAIATAAQLSVVADNAALYASDPAGAKASHKSSSRKVRAMRSMMTGAASLQERLDATTPLSEIVEEEDRKERGA